MAKSRLLKVTKNLENLKKSNSGSKVLPLGELPLRGNPTDKVLCLYRTYVIIIELVVQSY